MDRYVGRALRWARAALVAAVALGSGVVAHTTADGRLPGAVALGALFALCWVGAARFLARPASTLRIVALVAAGQTVIHVGLTAMAGHRGDPPLARAPAAVVEPAAAPLGDGRRVGSLADLTQGVHQQPAQLSVPVPVQHLLADLTGPHTLMALAHLAAAVVLGWWLARGERLLFSVLALTATGLGDLAVRARALAATPAHVRVARPDPHHLLVAAAVAVARGRSLTAAAARRGPPLPAHG